MLNNKFQRTVELMRHKERLEGQIRIREQDMLHRIQILEKEIGQLQEKILRESAVKKEWERCQKKLQELDILEKNWQAWNRKLPKPHRKPLL